MFNIKRILKYITPPIVIILFRMFFPFPKIRLFDGRDSRLFVDNAYKAKIYGEYGVGYSTLSIRELSNSIVVAAETNKEYLLKWKTKLSLRENDDLIHINIGEIEGWGYPKDYSMKDSFIHYFESIWKSNEKPDFVLIDGRFRVACFLTSLLLSDPGTKILFDDYNRAYYHVIEDIIEPIDKTETQALFVRPEKIDADKIIALRDSFSMVML